MANNVLKVNGIAIADIAKINGQNDADLAKLNGEEFVSAFGGITWSTDDTVPASGGGGKFGNVGAQGFTNGISKATYEHNGSSWSTTGSTSGEHDVGGGGGTQGAAVIFAGWDGTAGDDIAVTEEYDGSSWSSANNMVQSCAFCTGGGVLQTAQMVTGGSQYNPTVRDLPMTQTYNGTNWSNESVDSTGLQTGSCGESGGGGLDAFFIAGGALESPGVVGTSQIFNQSASSWTSKASMSLEARYVTSATDGTRVYKIGGYDAPAFTQTAVVESWVENTWTTETSMPAGIRQGGNGTGGAEASGGAACVAGAGSGGATNSYFIAAAS